MRDDDGVCYLTRLTFFSFELVSTIGGSVSSISLAYVSIAIRLARAIYLTYYFDHYGDIMITNPFDDRDCFDHVITIDSRDVSKTSSLRRIDHQVENVHRIF